MEKLPLAEVVTTHREQCNKNTITMVDLAMTLQSFFSWFCCGWSVLFIYYACIEHIFDHM